MTKPEKALLRRSEVRRLLGITSEQVSACVECGALSVVRLTPNGRAYFRAAEVWKLAEPTKGGSDALVAE